MAYDAAAADVLLFDGVSGDTYTYHAGAWNHVLVTGPSGREAFGLTYDASDGYVLLFGGLDGLEFALGDTWKFSGGTWTNITGTLATSPSARVAPQITFDAATGQVILFGGYAWPFANFNDTWSFSAGSWTNITPGHSPPGRYGGGMVDDTGDGAVVLYSGDTQLGSNGARNETWVWSATPLLGEPTISASPSAPLPAEVVTFGSSVLGGTPPFTYSWRFGDGNSSTSGTPTHTFNAEGYYVVQLWVNDSAGHSANTSLRIHVYIPLALAPLQATPNPATLGQPVNFTAAATDGTPPYTYSWTFGDGGIGGNLASITHIYTTNGPFVAQVSVVD
ncbi:MAG: PKD domain-containing protein, partial [Thermoplasmata archaeon]